MAEGALIGGVAVKAGSHRLVHEPTKHRRTDDGGNNARRGDTGNNDHRIGDQQPHADSRAPRRASREHHHPVPIRYPTPRTVVTYRGRGGSSPSLSLKCPTWTSMMLSLPTHESPHTDSSSCRLRSTAPGRGDNSAN